MQLTTIPKQSVAAEPSPSVGISILIFLVSVLLMAYLRLVVFPDRFISLTYGLPLLVCFWRRDRRLLWSMAVSFVAMATYKTFFVLPVENPRQSFVISQWAMQVLNIMVIGAAVHFILNLTAALKTSNAKLQQANEELSAREEELARQNEELNTQAEELAQQNEEIQQQSEELQSQTEELQALNTELGQRQSMLRVMLESLRSEDNDRRPLDQVSTSILRLFSCPVPAAAVLERVEADIVVRAHSGPPEASEQRWTFDHSFAAIVMEQGRTAFIEDVARRPDLQMPTIGGQSFRSVLATPFRLNGRPAGTVEVYAEHPRKWTTEEFHIIEWVAGHCSLVLEVRRLQKQLAENNASLALQVKERTTELQDMVNELEHFSYSITHDMRAPLRAMQGYAGLLAADCNPILNSQQREYLQRITSAAARMDALITDALSFSRALRQEMPLQAIDVQSLLQEIIQSYPDFQPPRAEISIAQKLPPVLANEAGLTQCLSNLLGNAVKFVEKATIPKIVIGAEEQQGFVRIWIRDNGIGISQDMRPRIFNMFQRASKQYEGTGIGLALVRKVCERMGGCVGFESELGKGSCFWIDLRPANTKA